MADHTSTRLLELTAQVVVAYLSRNALAQTQIGELIASTHVTLTQLSAPSEPCGKAVEAKPAVPIRKSITPDAIICLEDGKEYKSLKRHLRVSYGLTPDAYREKWGLPADYPMVAPNYSAKRSSIALKSGLGRKPWS